MFVVNNNIRTHDPVPRAPRLAVPAGATDCHAHVFGPYERYPLAEPRTYSPAEAGLAGYQAMHRAIGVQRGVLVQPSVYGFDNRAHLAALAELGPDYRMIAVLPVATPEATLREMHAAGVRGVRLTDRDLTGGVTVDQMEAVAERIGPFGWHIQVQYNVTERPEMAERIARCPVPVVIDHMGRCPAARGVGDPGMQGLLALLRDGGCWVKLSGAYYLSDEATPYADVAPIARALIAANPDRLVWGTDWPHPGADRPPNCGDLMDLLGLWTADAALHRRILVDNPARLYGFAAG